MSNQPQPNPAPTSALSIQPPAWVAGIYGQLDAARPVAELLARSEMVPKGFAGKPNDILIAGAMGARLGLDLFSSLAGIAVVNGRATLWGDAMLAVCRQHREWQDYAQEVTGDGDAMTATVAVTRRGQSPHTETFSVSDAKRAGLWGKQGPWTQHPKRMLALRARAFALRTVFADALAGFHAREEFDDAIDVTESATVAPEPKPAKRRTIQATAEVAPIVEHGAASAPEASPESQPANDDKPRDLSVEACREAFGSLWRTSEAGKSSAKGILATYSIASVGNLAQCDEAKRAAFLDDVAEAHAKLEG